MSPDSQPTGWELPGPSDLPDAAAGQPDPGQAAAGDETRMTLVEHLAELRNRLIISVIALTVTTLISFLFANYIFQVLIQPAGGVTLIYTEVTEMLGTYMKVALLSGLILSLPVIMYQVIMFVAPGLTRQEKRYVYILMPWALGSFILGAAFAYFVLVPPALGFLLGLGGEIATPQIKIGNYVNTVSSLVFWIGLIFETPMVIFFLARIGIVNARLLSQFRRYAIMAAFILGAIITPTFDPINQTLVAIPLIILYEIGILLARVGGRRRQSATSTPDN